MSDGFDRRSVGVAFVSLVVLALVVAGGAVAAQPDRVLVVEDAETGERLFTAPVANDTTVTLAYNHSVEGSPVRDVYAVRGDELVMTRMEFSSYGWGFPAQANVTRKNGSFVTYPDDVRLSELYVSPGDVAGHRLHVGDETYDLVARSGGDTVRIHVEHRSILHQMTP
ncbi:C4-dicarboxylate ABC transporter [Haloprofundus marisrubri]|uniref:C4-dicarboxylate ABC transporter n=1 Tax=Haloprofundus marisrubri TaxID=1514971 RepID=A0A0W1RE07_9EURY|nr:DUF1850 domain-containing protein [Haloprofundus marisrubri]KTG11661.1 C4-dicarboxylate ABC transporter [Haloprofundus marisrubri]